MNSYLVQYEVKTITTEKSIIIAETVDDAIKEALKKDTLDNLMTKLSELRCDRYAEEGLVPGEPMLDITIQGAQPHQLTLFKPASDEATEILARSSQSPHLFYLSKWSADGFKKTEADFFDIPAADSQPK